MNIAAPHDREASPGRLTRGFMLKGYGALARSLGLDPLSMLEAFNLPPDVLANPEVLISVDSAAALLEESARRSGQEAFGLLLSETRRIGDLGVLAAVLREEPTLRAALESLARYICVQNEGLVLTLDDMGEFTMILLELQLRKPKGARQGIEMAAGVTLQALRALARGSFDPVSVCFRHGHPQGMDVHKRLLGAAIDFGHPFNAIVCRSRDLDVPIESADPDVGRALKRRLDQDLFASRDEPLDRVRGVVRRLIPNGGCSVGCVAEQLGTHRRTLNRHLAAAGASVTTIIDDVRAELAETYLGGGVRTLYLVGHMLGFASGAEFSRWFRRRFGMTPSQWVAGRQDPATLRSPRVVAGVPPAAE